MNKLRETITRHPFFNGMKPAHLDIVVHGAREAKFEAGATLFREREPANRFFLIQKGKVLLEAHDPADGTVPVQELGVGELLGWSWLLPPFAWHFRARALEPTELIVLDGAHLLVAAERHHKFGYELMKRIAQVVIGRLQATRKQLLAREVESVLKG
jgi:CRP/FNR family transcriptional regulator, cyclic AMP receptor protein